MLGGAPAGNKGLDVVVEATEVAAEEAQEQRQKKVSPVAAHWSSRFSVARLLTHLPCGLSACVCKQGNGAEAQEVKAPEDAEDVEEEDAVKDAAKAKAAGAEGSSGAPAPPIITHTGGESGPTKSDSAKSGPASTPAGAPASSSPAGAPASSSASPAAAGSGTLSQPPEQPAAAAASAEPDSARVSRLLHFYREISDNVVREGTAGWEHAGYAGVLATEFQLGWGASRPLSLVFLFDAQAQTARNDDQALASHHKQLPVLPYWTWGSLNDGDEAIRALILGDVAGPQQKVEQYKPIWDISLSLQRDPLWGTVMDSDAAKEASALELYRKSSVHTPHTLPLAELDLNQRNSPVPLCVFFSSSFAEYSMFPMDPMSLSVKAELTKPRGRPPLDHLTTHAHMFHRQHVRLATFDLRHPVWKWDRSYPRGILVAESERSPSAIPYHLPQSTTPRMVLLQHCQWDDTVQLRQGGKAAAAAAAAAQSKEGGPGVMSVDVLIPAPNRLLDGPCHPLYTMEPTVWIPFAAVPDVQHFITPYHRGFFNTPYTYSSVGPVALSATREPLYHPNSKRASGPFHGTVRYGSVVSATVAETRTDSAGKPVQSEQQIQGVVLLTFVRMSSGGSGEFMKTMARCTLPEGAKLPANVDSAFTAMPKRGPVPCLFIWSLKPPQGQQQKEKKQKRDAAYWHELKLKSLARYTPMYQEAYTTCVLRRLAADASASAAAAAATCWQQVATEEDAHHWRVIRAAEVTKVWKENELGALGTLTSERLQPILHRGCLEGPLLQLANPAQPTRLRNYLKQPQIQHAVEKFVCTTVQLPAEFAGRDFLRSIREAAVGGFPVHTLLDARAAINCAQPLPLPGTFSNPAFAHDSQSPPASSLSPSPPPIGGSASSRPAARARASRTPASRAATTDNMSDEEVDEEEEAPTPTHSKKKDTKKGKAKKKPASKKKKNAAETDRETSSPSPPPGITNQMAAQGKALFMKLADVTQPESLAPLAAATWLQWTKDEEHDASQTGGKKLMTRLDEWKEEVWAQLLDYDPALYHFMCFQANLSLDVDVAVDTLTHTGNNGKTWRADFRVGRKKTDFLWVFTGGKQPALEDGSILAMHTSNVWYPVSGSGKSGGSGSKSGASAGKSGGGGAPAAGSAKGDSKKKAASSRDAAAALAATASAAAAKPGSQTQVGKKRGSGKAAGAADAADLDGEEDESTSTVVDLTKEQEGDAEEEESVVPLSGSKRQKRSDSAAAAAAEGATPTRSSRSAAATPHGSAAAAADTALVVVQSGSRGRGSRAPGSAVGLLPPGLSPEATALATCFMASTNAFTQVAQTQADANRELMLLTQQNQKQLMELVRLKDKRALLTCTR
jgi:hypothetical protein